ncbi:MAG: hypothetical protein AUJ97_09180 [Bacteroidetes bacterium CG2_30_32_10]|nr:MAG: hypothetical protein AUJ97_09180 [Bacteroidetes bacterium CG2_30_32_10]
MRKCFIIVLFTLFTSQTFSQKSEIGLFLGGSYYLGDLNPKWHFVLTKPAFGIIYRYNFNQRVTLKMDALYGTVAGNDAISKTNTLRNLSFKSPIIEISPNVEINFLPYQIGNYKLPFTTYIFGGIAIFKFDPQASFEGNYYHLQPLGTEGQRTSVYNKKPYSLINFSIPFGLGFKKNIGKYVSFGLEWGLRKTFTDYIDDVSSQYVDPSVLSSENRPISATLADRSGTTNNIGMQRGNSYTKDWYSYAGMIVTFKINDKKKCKCPSYREKEYQKRKK